MTTALGFLRSEFWILSWGASVQRAGLFVENSSEGARLEFRRAVISFAEHEILPTYSSSVTEGVNESNIVRLSDKGSEFGMAILSADGYRIGIAQKLLNLQLKYLWCLGSIPEPSQCPIDRVMINKARLRDQTAWTKIEDLQSYQQVVEAMKG